MYFLSLCEPNVQSDSLSLGGTFGYLTYDGTATATTDVTCVMGPNVTASQGRLYHIATLLWIIGVVTSGFSVLVMPIFIRGLIHLTGWMLTFLWVCLALSLPHRLIIGSKVADHATQIPWITFMAGAIMTTVNGTLLHRYNGVVGNLLLPLLWTTVICMLIGITIFTFEYSLEKHTPKGERISSRFKPVAVQRVSYSNARVSRTVVYDEDPVIKMTQVRVTATTG
jgi:hypothetical protein